MRIITAAVLRARTHSDSPPVDQLQQTKPCPHPQQLLLLLPLGLNGNRLLSLLLTPLAALQGV